MFTKKGIIYDYIYPRIKDNIIKSPELNNLYDFFSNVEVLPFEEISTSFFKEKFKAKYELSYASENIKEKIQNYTMKYSFILKFSSYIITVNIYSDTKVLNANFLHELKKYIQFTISIYPIKTNITINYHLSDEKKMIHKKGILTKNNVNSGSCMITSDHSVINIWRKEEILKVTLHELIHALYFDKYKDTNDLINHYRIRYNVSSLIMNTNEAYTELWANLMNCYLISKNETNQEELFNTLVSLEKCFSNFQAHKIIYHTNISNNKNIVDINKNTSVIAYYIIRSELYNNLDGFLNHCSLDINNENYLKIKDSHSWILFLKSLKKITKNNRRFNKKNKDIQYKTIRMSLLELKVF